jgi:hypothetical protein
MRLRTSSKGTHREWIAYPVDFPKTQEREGNMEAAWKMRFRGIASDVPRIQQKAAY